MPFVCVLVASYSRLSLARNRNAATFGWLRCFQTAIVVSSR